MIGQQLGHYRIERQLGAGGMGVVYRAWDTRLERPVALKLLARVGAAGEAARVLREARAASALSHPGICTVHEVGEAGGRAYIVMELVDGRPLADVVPRDGLPLDAVVAYGRGIADALAHAHDRGVVHRDLKTTNILVAPDGRTKILDFGLAARAAGGEEGDTRSAGASGVAPIAGTLAYMPPEVLRGQPADARSDVWSLGIVLYEMATGRLPFVAASPFDLSSRILRDPPPPVPDRVPAELRALIHRCLAKEPGQRYARAGEIAAVLGAVQGESRDGVSRRPQGARAIAVLPFKDLAGAAGDTHLGVGLADATITELSLVKSLLVRPTAAILRFQDAATDPLDAGRMLGVDAVVAGSFQRAGSRLRVTVQLIGTTDGRLLWGTKVDTSLEDMFQLQDDVSRQVARALEVELSRADERRLAQAQPGQAGSEAYELYLKGRVHLFDETLEAVNMAITCFEQARDRDPQFPQAYAGLAEAYGMMAFTFAPDEDWHERAREMCDRALALQPDLPEGRYIRGRLLWTPESRFDHGGALREFAAAIAARPSLNEAHHWIGVVLLHVGLFDESLRAFERALAINPDDLYALMHLAYLRYLEGKHRESLDISERTLRRVSNHWLSYQGALAQIQLGRRADAARVTERAAREYPGMALCYPLRGLLAALEGKAPRAEEEIALAIKNKRSFGHYHHVQYDIACIYAQLGRLDEAMRWLDDAAHNGFPCAPFFESDPLIAPVRRHPPFAALMTELRTECAGYRTLYHAQTDSSHG